MSESRNALHSIFNGAAELANDAERAAFLRRTCGQDARMRRRVEQLLRANKKTRESLEEPAVVVLKQTIELDLLPTGKLDAFPKGFNALQVRAFLR